MREKLRNELLTMLNSYVTVDQLQEIEVTLEMILGDYEIQERQTEVILYNSDIPETVKIYIVTKKIEGLSEKSLYLYNLVLTDFFRTVQKNTGGGDSKRYQIILVSVPKEERNLKQNT